MEIIGLPPTENLIKLWLDGFVILRRPKIQPTKFTKAKEY